MYQPVVPFSGLTGWRFLQRTYDSQMEAFKNSTALQRDTDYFRENIGEITSADDLVSDRRLMRVALGAFGLQDEINNTYLIKRMLEEGTVKEDALANRFVDKRYKGLSKAFGFGPVEILGSLKPGFAEHIIAKFERHSFEEAVGAQDDSMRIALNAERELAALSKGSGAERSNWFTIMGSPPMRKLFETALNLPSSFSQIDIEQQLKVFAERSSSAFGVANPAEFADPKMQEALLTRYTALVSIGTNPVGNSSSAIALTLLSNIA